MHKTPAQGCVVGYRANPFRLLHYINQTFKMMKKTLVALFALGCMAMAADVEYTIDNAYTTSGTSDLSSAVEAALAHNTEVFDFNQLRDTLSGDKTMTVTLSDMAWSINPATVENQGMLLTSVQLVSRDNTQFQNAVTMTVTVDGTSYTSLQAVYPAVVGNQRGLVTFTFETPVIITGAETLTLGIGGSGAGTSVIEPLPGSGHTLQGDTPVHDAWHVAVRLNVKTPEPATATLSLLALAGLASRRRRH